MGRGGGGALKLDPLLENGLTMSYRFNNTMYNLYVFIHVFLRFPVVLSTCSYTHGDKAT